MSEKIPVSAGLVNSVLPALSFTNKSAPANDDTLKALKEAFLKAYNDPNVSVEDKKKALQKYDALYKQLHPIKGRLIDDPEIATARKLLSSPEEQHVYDEKIRQSKLANPAVGVIDAIAGNESGLKQDLKADDFKAGLKTVAKHLTSSDDNAAAGAVGLKTDIKPDVKTAGAGGANPPDNGGSSAGSPTNNKGELSTEEQATAQNLKYVMSNGNGSPKEAQAYGKSMSIISAWRNGLFGDPESEDAKERRNYFIMDALATASRNLANDFGRVAAAYGGGTYSGENVSSQWEDRNRELNEAAVSAEEAGVEGSDKAVERQSIALEQQAQRLANLNTQQRMKLADTVHSYLYDKNGNSKYNLNDPTQEAYFRQLATLENELRAGGGEQNDWKALLTKMGTSVVGKIGKAIEDLFTD